MKEENETKCSSGLGIPLWKTEPRSVEDAGQICKILIDNNFEITGKSDLVAEFKKEKNLASWDICVSFKKVRKGS